MTPKQGADGGGLEAVRKLHLVLFCAVAARRRHAAAPARPGRGRAAARHARDRRGDRAAARPDRAAPRPAHPARRRPPPASAASSTASRATPRPSCFSDGRPRRRPAGRRQRRRASAWSPRRRSTVGAQPGGPARAGGRGRRRARGRAPRSRCASCREADGRYLVGATIAEIDPDSRMRLMEWCYVVCSHERLRGHRPAAAPLPESEAIVVSARRLPRTPHPTWRPPGAALSGPRPTRVRSS